ncbi:hypothetical protein PDE_08588 [Penicillium oxalicum 114-2]|uniref:Uncharacterized protein n=1 Tax=Penicillium oxalicum (strain 114-2 / CGMCC 5302) TaxID=933388 RepID=S7ZXU9_PENO1|nr:hypothetical protein PDE_08588 [Penicillium oxalicum 114-2]
MHCLVRCLAKSMDDQTHAAARTQGREHKRNDARQATRSHRKASRKEGSRVDGLTGQISFYIKSVHLSEKERSRTRRLTGPRGLVVHRTDCTVAIFCGTFRLGRTVDVSGHVANDDEYCRLSSPSDSSRWAQI